nr:MAG: replication associated protein [Cressdnaviricota sp.]
MSESLGINRHVVEEGNTGSSTTRKKEQKPKKQEHRKCFYTFTLFNFNDQVKLELNRQLKELCKKYIYGDEICPSTKKPHLQGFIALKKPMRITELKLINNPKLIPCNGNEEQNVKYCSKDGIVTQYGFPKPLKLITHLRPWQQEIFDLCQTEPDDRTVHWYWEPVGRIGKTQFTKYMFFHHKACFLQGGKHSDIINLIYNNNMDECEIVIFNIPRADHGDICYTALESIKDGMICNTKFECGAKIFNPPHVIVFANYPPNCPDNLSLDKWNITEIKT